MSVTFRQVERDEEVEALAHMAYHIWNEYWPAIIGQAQTDYMVEKFQSLNAFAPTSPTMATSTSSSCSTRTNAPRAGRGDARADIHDQGDTVAGRVNDDIESDRDGELARDTEDSPAPPPSPASSATPADTWRRTRTAFHLEDLPAEGAPRGGPVLGHHPLLRAPRPRARPGRPLPHGEQAQRDGHPRLQSQGLRGHRRRGNRHRRRLHHGRLHHGEEAGLIQIGTSANGAITAPRARWRRCPRRSGRGRRRAGTRGPGR